MGWAFGKVILLGEHAVVYGHPALAGAIDCRLHCRLTERTGGPLRLRVPAWDLDVASTDAHPVAAALQALLRGLDATSLSGDLEVQTRLPAAQGLGSSAALSVALVRTVAEAMGRTPSDSEVEALADLAERRFHENPSGVDVALAARGGLGLFVRGEPLQSIPAAPFALAVGLSGQTRNTRALVARVAAANETRPGPTGGLLDRLGRIARDGADAIATGRLTALGRLMSEAHQALRKLDVSTTSLDRLVQVALDAGAIGAKLTGAGGGGAVVAVAAGREEAVVTAWRSRGYDGFVCQIGARQ